MVSTLSFSAGNLSDRQEEGDKCTREQIKTFNT